MKLRARAVMEHQEYLHRPAAQQYQIKKVIHHPSPTLLIFSLILLRPQILLGLTQLPASWHQARLCMRRAARVSQLMMRQELSEVKP
ncbi:unnamed protein product, partial [Rotaria sp. Silwood2]